MATMTADSQAVERAPQMQTDVAPVNQGELTVTEVLQQVEKVQKVMAAVMKENEHYGTIPGMESGKKVLFKPGAEKLSMTFRLRPEYVVRRYDMSGDHREYEVICTLYSIATGRIVGAGVGSCSSKESKYRWRKREVNTGDPVPKAYWADRDIELIGGKGYGARKINGAWMIVRLDKVENENIADSFNTILKMAKKRAHVDAVLTALSVSDMFTQDLEEIKQNQEMLDDVEEATVVETKDKPQPQAPPATPSGETFVNTPQAQSRDERKITDGQVRRMMAIANKQKMPVDEVDRLCLSYGYHSKSDIQRADYEDIVTEIEAYQAPKEGLF